MDFIPLTTNEYKYVFCKTLDAHNGLPNDIKRLVWGIVQENTEPVCPATPKKLRPLTARMLRRGKRLLAQKRLY